jgi:hypothetical protein
MAAFAERQDGQTVLGDLRQEDSSVAIASKLGSVGALSLVDTAGVQYYIWVDTTGDLRISSTRADFITNPNSAGAVVGGQS